MTKFLLVQRRLFLSPPHGSKSSLILKSNARYVSSSSASKEKDDTAATTTTTTSTSTSKSKSNRQQFKDIPIHPSILKYVEMIGVGIPSRRKRSKKVRHELFQDWRTTMNDGSQRSGRTGSWTSPPSPFATSRVALIGQVGPSLAAQENSFPTNTSGIPEVALAGRSNVGKSTLLNALLYGNKQQTHNNSNNKTSNDGDNEVSNLRQFTRGRTPDTVKLPKGVKAKTSAKPGETRAITFYQLSSLTSAAAGSKQNQQQQGKEQQEMSHNSHTSHKLRLVDLPGYGFSFTPQDHDGFQELLLQYLLERGKPLKRVLLLLDGRHGFKWADIEFLEVLQQETFSSTKNRRKMPPIQVVLTKCDLVPREDLVRRVVLVKQQLSDILRRETSSLPVLLVSARPGVGFNNVQRIRGGQRGYRAKGGVLELQKELAALTVPTVKKDDRKS